MKFTDFKLNEKLLKGIDKAGFENCMPVQEATLEQTLESKDVFVQSQTGTGKTAAFLITILQLQNDPNSAYHKKTALIIAPTRELAVQIEKEAKLLASFLDTKIACFYGGVGYQKQEQLLRNRPDIIIGTPGRLIDFGEKRLLKFNSISIAVIDEADRLFDMGFLPDLRRIMKQMSSIKERLTMLYSATLNVRVRNLAWEYMRQPEEIEIKSEQVTVDKIEQELFHVGSNKKVNLMLGIINKYTPETAIIFTNTKHRAFEIAKRLEHNSIKSTYITGDLQQKKRLKVIEDIKKGTIKFLVATDVAARGLHIDDLDLVINYDLPLDVESYVHRIGRTARAGKTGRAVTLACEEYIYGLEPLEQFLNIKIPVKWPEEDLFSEDASAGMHFSDRQERNKHQKSERSRKPARKTSSQNKKRKAPERTVKTQKHTHHHKPRREQEIKYSAQPVETPEPKKKKRFLTLESTLRNISVIWKRSEKNSSKTQAFTHKNRGKSLEERLAYYNKKYGESFKVDPDIVESEKSVKKDSVLKRITRIMNKKRS